MLRICGIYPPVQLLFALGKSIIDQAFVFLCLNVKLCSLPQKRGIATHRHILFDLVMLPYCFNVVEFTFKCTQLILSPTDEVPENLSHTHCSRVGCIN